MKISNILKKVILYAILGFAVLLLVEATVDWRGSMESFKEGYNDATNDYKSEKISSIKEVSFKSTDGIDIKADVYEISDIKSPLILLFHQAGYSRGEYKEIAPKLNKLGFTCIAVDQRAGREVNGVINQAFTQATELGLKTDYVEAFPDMQATLNYAMENYPSRKIIIWGSSYSSSLVFVLQQKNTEAVSAVLAFSPGEYFTYEDKEINAYAKEVNCPVFITSAKNEYKNWQSIYEAIPSADKEYFLPELAGFHGSRALWEQNEGYEFYWEAVTAFLNRVKMYN